ncbi:MULTISPECIES: outer membrane protein transport protein [Pseudoalteromonas]|uniref:outer membrane protein transport protein n=1 Tax=Pseudoalteromonas TaxID=53246 RepID=UPI00102371FF|nr:MULTISPECIES: outer membrane protein transport protein [Pseudoalteromonas]MCF2862367.1 outer membrane protein transport protein [Pseudoalteromonas sp. CNAT2-18]MCG7557864.1 outer membrane protein transport protein [Pseudoalteromonas sp. CNAT2-18.1]MCG7570190.1 outer membrane protein transport protein [Pseudoalteromonas sp. CNC9-20]RZF77641.1 long-chain fatty acid transporter [Pseudoalteromonas sp. CO325X]TLX49829.1 long-chain fatty acid transporter [Pseudoalteromonas ruthenica]|tara:strand:+ start:67631 stop:68890 length:1260 start_codon:yes stop_codon:yes gene_type:complete
MQFKKTILAASLALLSTESFAAAFQLAEQNASGLGRAYAGEAAIADDASVVARNPALMSQFETAQLSVAAIYVEPDVSLEGESTNNGLNPNVLNDDSIAPSAVIPAGYFVLPVNDKVAVGFGAFSNFGLATEFASDYAAGQLAGETEIVTINSNVSVSYKVDEALTLALGVNHVYADAKIVRNLGANPLGAPASLEAVHLEGDDYGFGWNVGLAYDLDSDNRLGFHYRSETDLTFEGDYTNQLPAALGGLNGQTLPGTVDLTLPAIAEFSGSHQLNQDYGLHYSVLWTGWSSFDKLEAYVPVSEGPVFSKNEDFSDSIRVSIGGDYQLTNDIKLRAGLAFDESPVAQKHLSISIPDTDRFWLSFGAEWFIDEASSVDLGASILRGKTQNFVEGDNLGQQWGFESEGHAYLVGAQYNYSF